MYGSTVFSRSLATLRSFVNELTRTTRTPARALPSCADDGVTLEDRASLVTSHLHRDSLRVIRGINIWSCQHVAGFRRRRRHYRGKAGGAIV